jgi:hypothetical protein
MIISSSIHFIANDIMCCFCFVVLGLEFRAYTLSHSNSPFL